MKVSIFEEGCQFAFFQAVRVLERLYPDRERVGRTAHPSREVARFRARLTLAFPASEIHTVELGKDGVDPQPRVTVNFMGLIGPSAELPIPYTELLLERASHKDHTLRDFLDLFNHRMISLFHRAWEKYRFHVYYEQGDEDTFSQYLCDLIGIGTPGLQRRLAVNDKVLCFYAGLIGQRPRSASALAGILRDYYEVPVETQPYSGRWVRLGAENETRLCVQNTELGVNMICGARIWDRQSKFRLRLGPLHLKQFRSFLPCGDAWVSLNQLVRLFAGQEYDFDVQLVLKAGEVPACELRTDVSDGPRLGWSSWLKTREFTRDAEEPILTCDN